MNSVEENYTETKKASVEIISDNLKLLRKRAKYSQEYVANEAFMSCSYYRDVEHGVGNPTAKMIDRLSELYGIPAWQLLKPME